MDVYELRCVHERFVRDMCECLRCGNPIVGDGEEVVGFDSLVLCLSPPSADVTIQSGDSLCMQHMPDDGSIKAATGWQCNGVLPRLLQKLDGMVEKTIIWTISLLIFAATVHPAFAFGCGPGSPYPRVHD